MGEQMNSNTYDDLEFLEPVIHSAEDIKLNMKKQNQKKKVRRFTVAKEISLYLFIIVLCLYIVPNYIILRTVVVGGSMENSLYSGENVLVEKVSYYFKEPERFDVIVFDHENISNEANPKEPEEEYYVKRIIGLPKETVQIKDGAIYINDSVLSEDFGKNSIINPGMAESPITLGEDEYFVLGDNRVKSKDSRYYSVGLIKKEDIEGRVWIRIWPVEKFGKIK